MSYILDALKKSDQQRQRGLTPTIPAVQVTLAKPRQPLYYGLFAVVLLGLGIAIGWLHPWQATPVTEPTPAKSPASPPLQPAPTHLPAPLIKPGAAELPMQIATFATKLDTLKPDLATKIAPEKPSEDAAQKPIPMAELPVAIQQEMPAMSIQLHAYSSNPVERLVSINSRMLGEGESLAPGLKLEQITPDGMIFSFKGYRFQHGIH